MAKKSNQKVKLLVLAWQLLKKGDEDHPISTPALIQVLEREGIPAERKSIYTDMETLRDFGLDVQLRKGKAGGWFIGQREFRRQVYVDRRVKTENESVYYAIDKLHTAIAGGRAVSFRYFDYNVAKEKVFRREGKRYTVSPYGLIWSDENYYLVGWDHGELELRHYRVDKTAELIITGLPREGDESCKSFDLAEYGRKHFHMFSGREAKVRLRCENRFVNVMLDRFGQEAMLIPDGPGHFTLTVEAVVSPQFYGWLFGLGEQVELTAPDWAVEEYRERLHKALEG